MEIEFYTSDLSPRCDRVRRILDHMNVAYVSRDIDIDAEAMTDALFYGISSFPALYVKDEGKVLYFLENLRDESAIEQKIVSFVQQKLKYKFD